MIVYLCDNCNENGKPPYDLYASVLDLYLAPDDKWLCFDCYENMYPDNDLDIVAHPMPPSEELRQIKQRLKDEGMVI